MWEGKNIADFVDPDILDKLSALEKEEEEREQNGFYNLDGLEYDSGRSIVNWLLKKIRDFSLRIKIDTNLYDLKTSKQICFDHVGTGTTILPISFIQWPMSLRIQITESLVRHNAWVNTKNM